MKILEHQGQKIELKSVRSVNTVTLKQPMPRGEEMTAFQYIKQYRAGASNNEFMGSIARLKHLDCNASHLK